MKDGIMQPISSVCNAIFIYLSFLTTYVMLGLEYYDTMWIGLAWHLVILLFSVLQFELNKLKSEGKADNILLPARYALRSLIIESQYDWYSIRGKYTSKSIKRFFTLISFVSKQVGANFLVISYVTFLFIGLLTTASIVNMMYVLCNAAWLN